MKNRLRVFIGFVIMVSSFSYGIWLRVRPGKESELPIYVKTFGGNQQVLEPLKSPTNLEVFRLIKLRQDNRVAPASRDYSAERCNFVIPIKQRSILSDAMTSPKLTRGVRFACDEDHEVKLSFYHNEDRIDVLISFGCNSALVLSGDVVLGQADIGKVREQLLPIIKDLFPQDTAIQDLRLLHDR